MQPINLDLKISHNFDKLIPETPVLEWNIHYFMSNREKEIKTFELVVNTQRGKSEQS